MEKWIFDSPDVPGETFRQFVKDCYYRNLLIQSKLVVGGKRVDLKRITMPLLNFYGQYDHLVPPEACNQLTGAVGSKDTEDICLDTGHIGIYVSSKTQREFAPKIVKWLQERDDGPAAEKRPVAAMMAAAAGEGKSAKGKGKAKKKPAASRVRGARKPADRTTGRESMEAR
jgi:polyhydroxyalkanoate synthase